MTKKLGAALLMAVVAFCGCAPDEQGGGSDTSREDFVGVWKQTDMVPEDATRAPVPKDAYYMELRADGTGEDRYYSEEDASYDQRNPITWEWNGMQLVVNQKNGGATYRHTVISFKKSGFIAVLIDNENKAWKETFKRVAEMP